MKTLNHRLLTKYPSKRNLLNFNQTRYTASFLSDPMKYLLHKISPFITESNAIAKADSIFQSCYVQSNSIGFKTLYDFKKSPTNRNLIEYDLPFQFYHQLSHMYGQLTK